MFDGGNDGTAHDQEEPTFIFIFVPYILQFRPKFRCGVIQFLTFIKNQNQGRCSAQLHAKFNEFGKLANVRKESCQLQLSFDLTKARFPKVFAATAMPKIAEIEVEE